MEGFTYRKMGSQTKRRPDLLGPRWILSSIVMAAALFLPSLSLDSLLCNFCPLQHKGTSCPDISSQCLPDQRCSSSRGHFGSLHVLSAQGCVDAELCGSHEMASFRGVKYNVSHTCCCRDKCNGHPHSNTNLKKLLGMLADKLHYPNITVLREERWDSCVNYTSSNTLPTNAS
ncbi:sperm acrosome membrane-associated protein 4-like [Pseudochaenichthys georgianus]|uniref:sperm acrosome membrane-associated protein 4-like n=1 Tax=Pseudochaenichthys georgianus TaxID=52239 RepID=UPI001469D53A|nr:protein Bouncer-like [Pseudochaenichthys georgianus]